MTWLEVLGTGETVFECLPLLSFKIISKWPALPGRSGQKQWDPGGLGSGTLPPSPVGKGPAGLGTSSRVCGQRR